MQAAALAHSPQPLNSPVLDKFIDTANSLVGTDKGAVVEEFSNKAFSAMIFLVRDLGKSCGGSRKDLRLALESLISAGVIKEGGNAKLPAIRLLPPPNQISDRRCLLPRSLVQPALSGKGRACSPRSGGSREGGRSHWAYLRHHCEPSVVREGQPSEEAGFHLPRMDHRFRGEADCGQSHLLPEEAG